MSKGSITPIPYVRKVFYATYANLPVTGLKVGDLGYATDRLVFYRWSGAAWQAVTMHSSSGTAANIPAAADLPNGSLYYETDTKILKQVQAGAWEIIGETPEYRALTVALFQANPATGSMATAPEDINDNNTNSSALANAVDQYAEVDLKGLFKIKQWRQFGDIGNSGDGVWKIQYMDAENAWQDWVTGIAVRTTADWSGWSTETEVKAIKIRLVCTTNDTNDSEIGELEVKY